MLAQYDRFWVSSSSPIASKQHRRSGDETWISYSLATVIMLSI